MSDSSQQESARFFLDVKGGAHRGTRVEIPPEGLIVGRSSKCGLVLPDARISRHHAEFCVREGQCYVEDIGSRNGVVVQGKRVEKLCLQDGDLVDLGYCRMRLRIEESIKEHPLVPEVVGHPHELGSQEKSAAKPGPRASLHPFAFVSLGFVVLACLKWVFAVGAVVFGVLALLDIRRRGKYSGMGLAIVGLVLGLGVGGVSVYFDYGAALRTGGGTASRRCQQNLTIIADALERYAWEHNGLYPRSLEDLAYVGPRDWLNCPAGSRRGLGECRYLFPGAGRLYDPSSDAVVVCDGNLTNHGRRGGNVLRANGTVEWLPAVEFELTISEARGR